MNIFYLDPNAFRCARYHCDKHVIKMIVEYAQLMSTAHRILDGQMVVVKNPITGRRRQTWILNGEEPVFVNGKFDIVNSKCMKATHVNHPSNVWTRSNVNNYSWLLDLWMSLGEEYTKRYGKQHNSITTHTEFLNSPPTNINRYLGFQQPPQAMPEEYREDDSVEAYRKYYLGDKLRFAKYKNSPVPPFIMDFIIANDSRTHTK